MIKVEYSNIEELYVVTLPYKSYRFKYKDDADMLAAKYNRNVGGKRYENAFNIMMHDDRIPTKKKQFFR